MDSSSDFKVDKTAFSVVPLSQAHDERDYWLSKTPHERLRALELIRQTIYGYTPVPADFKECLKLFNEKRVRYELKDLADVDHLS